MFYMKPMNLQSSEVLSFPNIMQIYRLEREKTEALMALFTRGNHTTTRFLDPDLTPNVGSGLT